MSSVKKCPLKDPLPLTIKYLATIATTLGTTAPWIGFWLLAMVLDYITGMLAAAYNKELNSKKGILGAAKKLAQCFMVALAFLINGVLVEGAEMLGMAGYPTGGIVIAAGLALLVNAFVSIL